jgi:hypothetical protein
MAAKKKAKKKTVSKKVQPRKAAPKKSAKKKSAKKKSPAKSKSVKKKVSRTKASPKRVAAKPAAKPAPRTRSARQSQVQRKRQVPESMSSRLRPPQGDPASEGLSNSEHADSESVGELLEEGNTFEAGVIRGVERADDSDGKEVRTRQFAEDDVPEEYLDEE